MDIIASGRTLLFRETPQAKPHVADHEFIRHPTAVHYSTAQRFRISQISAALHDGRCHLRADMAEALLARVRAGLLQSPYTVKAIAEYARQQFPAGGAE